MQCEKTKSDTQKAERFDDMYMFWRQKHAPLNTFHRQNWKIPNNSATFGPRHY